MLVSTIPESWFLEARIFIKCEKHLTFVIAMCVIFMLTNFQMYEEGFFWFSGATSYTFPYSMMLFGLVAFMEYNDCHKKKYLFISLICGACAMGGSLTVTGTGCYILLLMCVFYYLKKREISWLNILVFSVWFICALINAIAPGNFTRHGYVDETGLHLVDSVIQSINFSVDRILYFANDTIFISIIILLLVCGILIGEKIHLNIEYAVVSFFAMFTPIVTIFPMQLGYSASGYFPNRCCFMLDCSILLATANSACVIGCCLVHLFKTISIKEVVTILMVVSCCFFLSKSDTLKNSSGLNVRKQLVNNTYSEHYKECVDFFDKLSTYDRGEDVVITMSEFPANIDYFFNFVLLEDSSSWVNDYVARYYGLNSLTLQ